MLGYVLNQGGTLSSDYELGIKVATPIGTFCGQILFGWLADVYGRKSIYGSGSYLSCVDEICLPLNHQIDKHGLWILWSLGWGFVCLFVSWDQTCHQTIVS